MKLDKIRTIAKLHRIKPGNFSKTELIKMIQTDEGNIDCYANDIACDRVDCLWRNDCFEATLSLNTGRAKLSEYP